MKNKLNTYKSILILCLVGLVCVSSVELQAQQNDKYGSLSFNNAINVSGKQRMFTQKISKAYLYLLNNVNDSQAKKDLLSSQIIFEEQNRVLIQNSKFKDTNDKLIKVNELWKSFKNLIETKPNYDNAKKVIDKNTELLKATNEVVLSIISASKKSIESGVSDLGDSSIEDKLELENIINISGRQRMLSQRLAFYYYANRVELKDKNSTQMLNNVFNELDGAINKLLVYKLNTSKIDEKIGLAFSKWNGIKKYRSKLMKQEFEEAEMYKMSNELTSIFNEITLLYEKIEI